ncbi:MAG: hypothetical protein JWN40_4741 [Phycisphaerales bacterium]|nr:hypothetical protein [Phycisphaerales bacterium]
MIVLTTPPPGNTADFVACLRGLLAQAVVIRGDTVKVAGDFPAMRELTIDLTGATPLDHPAGRWLDGTAGEVLGEFSVDALQVIGHPFGDAQRPIEVDASARQCRGQFVKAADGATALRLVGAVDGRLRASVARSTVERICVIEANKAARAQGVEIKDVQVAWRSDGGPRGLAVEVQVKAKKGFLPAAVVRVRGRLQIDASLNATISGLSVDGEGMVGTLGAGLIRPKLMQAEGMSKSLLGLPLDELRIKDVRLVVLDDMLTVEADFAG